MVIMKKFIWSLLTVSFIFVTAYPVSASDTLKIEPSVSADFVTRYVWRGMLLNSSPAVQPTLDFTYGGLSFGSWASYTFALEELQEVDLYLSYNYNFLTLTLNDYYNPNELYDTLHNYFDWDKSTSPHALELAATLSDFGDLPLSLTAGVFFYGNDRDDSGNNYYSTYIELGYFKTIGKNDFSAFLGFTPAEGYYSDKLSIVNVGVSVVRTIEITDKFSLPIAGSFIVNPDAKNVFFVLGITL